MALHARCLPSLALAAASRDSVETQRRASSEASARKGNRNSSAAAGSSKRDSFAPSAKSGGAPSATGGAGTATLGGGEKPPPPYTIGAGVDCPVTGGDYAAFDYSLPAKLRDLEIGCPGFTARRVWATALALEQLLALEEHIFIEETPEGEGVTLADKALDWLEREGEAYPRFGEMLPEVRKAAAGAVAAWEARNMELQQSCQQSEREAHASAKGRASRSAAWAGRVAQSVAHCIEKTDAFGAALVQLPTHDTERWQKCLIFLTTFFGMFLVNIWLYWSRSTQCCAQLRAALRCPPDPAAPCRGFTGNCGDIRTQFADLFLDRPDLRPAECEAFPDPRYVSHRIALAAIMIAATVPLTVLFTALFELANQPQLPERWLRFSGLLSLGFGRVSWLFSAHSRDFRRENHVPPASRLRRNVGA